MVSRAKKPTFPKENILEKIKWTSIDDDIDIPAITKYFIDLTKCIDQTEKIADVSKKFPIYNLLRKLLNMDKFVSQINRDQLDNINDLLNILMDLDSESNDDDPVDIITSIDIIDNGSNSQIRKKMRFEYSKTTGIPETWLCVKHIKRKPSFSINSNEMGGHAIKDELQRIIEEEDNEFFNIENISSTNRNVNVTTADLNENRRIMEYMNKVKPDWDIHMSVIALPQILIKGVNFNTQKSDEWIKRMIKQNQFKDNDQCKILHFNPGKGKYYGLYNLYMEVSQETRTQIQEKWGIICVYSQRLTVIDYFNIPICGRCLSFGHHKEKCAGKVKKCPFGCPISHEMQETCPRSLDPTKQKCPNCFKIGHSAYSKECQFYLDRLEREIQTRNYAYDWIMQ